MAYVSYSVYIIVNWYRYYSIIQPF